MKCSICSKYVRSPTKDTKDLGFCGECRIKKWQNYVEILKEKSAQKRKNE